MDIIKDEVRAYWTQRADGFAEQRMRELESEKAGRWLAEMHRYFPEGKKLRILDIGTGTGFFSILLAKEGHEVIGIDLTAQMIAKAKDCASQAGVQPEFMQMDAEMPQFEAESFDVLVTRNLTWTLPHLPKAYKSWFTLLKKGGMVINFDGDYGSALEDEDEVELPENHAHKLLDASLQEQNELITSEVHAYHQPRPQWDVQLLGQAGFERILVDHGVWKRIYDQVDEFYNPTPIFTIVAYKA